MLDRSAPLTSENVMNPVSRFSFDCFKGPHGTCTFTLLVNGQHTPLSYIAGPQGFFCYILHDGKGWRTSPTPLKGEGWQCQSIGDFVAGADAQVRLITLALAPDRLRALYAQLDQDRLRLAQEGAEVLQQRSN